MTIPPSEPVPDFIPPIPEPPGPRPGRIPETEPVPVDPDPMPNDPDWVPTPEEDPARPRR